MSLPRSCDFVNAGPYAEASEVGYRAMSFQNRRADVADQKYRERAFMTLQRVRTFDDMFVQSGGLVTSARALERF